MAFSNQLTVKNSIEADLIVILQHRITVQNIYRRLIKKNNFSVEQPLKIFQRDVLTMNHPIILNPAKNQADVLGRHIVIVVIPQLAHHYKTHIFPICEKSFINDKVVKQWHIRLEVWENDFTLFYAGNPLSKVFAIIEDLRNLIQFLTDKTSTAFSQL